MELSEEGELSRNSENESRQIVPSLFVLARAHPHRVHRSETGEHNGLRQLYEANDVHIQVL